MTHAAPATSDVVRAFTDAMASSGLIVPGGVTAGTAGFVRFDGPSDKPGRGNAFYMLRTGEWPVGWYGDWKQQLEKSWSFHDNKALSSTDRSALNREQDRIRRELAEAKALRWAEVAEDAIRLWNAAGVAAIDPRSHPYVKAKGIDPRGLRIHTARDGTPLIAVPMYAFDEDGKALLQSLQMIDPGGSKRFLKAGRVEGCFFPIPGNAATTIICEGVATAATCAVATGFTAFAAFNSGNLVAVAKAVAHHRTDTTAIIAADDDRHPPQDWSKRGGGRPWVNAGRVKGQMAADAIRSRLVLPTFADAASRHTDFNDLGAIEGSAAVKRQLLAMANGNAHAANCAATFHATAFVLRDPLLIPRREHLYGKHLTRKYVSLKMAKGGVGKTAMSYTEALAMVTGRNLLDVGKTDQLRVWLYGLEDPQEEAERRIAAACLHFGITAADLGGRLFSDSGRDQPLVIATPLSGGGGGRIVRPVVDALVAELVARRIDVLSIDPFVSCHTVSENDNGAMDMVAKEWGRVAEAANCAVELTHHVRKLNGEEATAESGRGAVAIIDAARSVIVLNRMSDADAKKMGIEPQHRCRLFRGFPGKVNLAPPAEDSTWYQLVSVDLGNGDNIGVCARYTLPDAFDDVTQDDLRAVKMAVQGGCWRASSQCKNWVGVAVADALNLDLADAAARAKVISLLRTWLRNGVLREVERKDASRQPRPFVVVADDANK